ncbi:MAG TPA: S24 family peptidase [Burkholderiaceae bacterium]|nr:S24 family peptidase [Burkholderiaceae bacterium]
MTTQDEIEPDEVDVRALPREPLDLIPGFRDRLLMELDAAGVAPRRRIGTLCRITGRSGPSVRRWIDLEEPGLPDLESFARLCQSLKVDVNYILGLTPLRLPLPEQKGELEDGDEPWLKEVRRVVSASLGGCEPMVMRGDDMAPKINDGDLLFIDRRQTIIAGNGIYLIDYMGRTMVRIVEDRLSDGIVLRCANERYADLTISPASIASSEFRIAGKVLQRLTITSL